MSNAITRIFKEDYKELFELQRQEVRELRVALKEKEEQLFVTEQAAVSVLLLYGFEAVQMYKDKLAQERKL